jgi:hypothetical protein
VSTASTSSGTRPLPLEPYETARANLMLNRFRLTRSRRGSTSPLTDEVIGFGHGVGLNSSPY